MNAFEAYELYNALNTHFKRKTYDYHKNNGKVKCSVAAFEKTNSIHYYRKLAKHKDPKGLILSSLISKRLYWVSDLFTPECTKEYLEWKKRQESISYLVGQIELGTIDDLQTEIVCKGKNHPPLLKRYMQGKLSFDALCIIVDITRCYSYWDKKMAGDVIWDELGMKIKKYTPFIKYDRDKFKAIIKEKVNAYVPPKKENVELHPPKRSGTDLRAFQGNGE